MPLHWDFGSEEGQVAVRRLDSVSSSPAARRNTVDSFELVFRRPKSAAFDIRATRTVPFTGAAPIALAALNEAAANGHRWLWARRARRAGLR